MAVGIAAVLFVLAGVHVYWARGGRWGVAAAVPSAPGGAALFRPRPAETLAVAAGLVGAALVVLAAGGVWTAPVAPEAVRGAAWALSAVFVLRAVGEFRYVGLFKRVKGTPFSRWDTGLFTPLCAALALGVAWVAVRA